MHTFMPIRDGESPERITTTLFPSEIIFIKETKGWDYNELVREGARAKLARETNEKTVEKRILRLEEAVFK